MKKLSSYLLVFGMLAGLLIVTQVHAGGTGVYINGQQLTSSQLQQAQYLAGNRIPPARYWYNAATNVWGYEGGPAMGYFGANANRNANYNVGNGGGNTYYHSNNTGISAGSSGGCTYVMGSDFSYTGGGC